MEAQKGMWVTLGGVGAALSLAAALWPHIPKFQTVEAADLHAQEDAKALIVLAHGQAHILTIVLRSQVNECVTQATKLKQDERATCDGYRREYEQAERKLQTLYRATVKQEGRK